MFSCFFVVGMKWKQGQWSNEEVAILQKNINAYCQVCETTSLLNNYYQLGSNS